jgi:hypothetical protein
LLLFRDVAAILRRHCVLLLSDLVIFAVKLSRLRMRHIAFFHLAVNPMILVRQALIDMLAPRVVLLPSRIGKRRADGYGDQSSCGYSLNKFEHQLYPKN